MKDLIIIGPPLSGKSLLVKMLFGIEKTYRIDARNPKLFENNFLYNGLEPEQILLFEDLNPKIHMDEFYLLSSTKQLYVNQLNKKPFFIKKPLIVITCNSNDRRLSNASSFTRRFNIIDVEKIIFSEILDIIKEYKIIIQSARF